MDKVEVRLREYDSLRSELLERIRGRYGLVAAVLVAAGFWADGLQAQDGADLVSLVGLAIISAVVIVGIWFYLGRAIAELSTAIADIEQSINAAIGIDALSWETNRQQALFVRSHRTKKKPKAAKESTPGPAKETGQPVDGDAAAGS